MNNSKERLPPPLTGIWKQRFWSLTMILAGSVMFIAQPLRPITNPALLPSLQLQHVAAIVVWSFGFLSINGRHLPSRHPAVNFLFELARAGILSLLIASLLICSLTLLYGGVRFELSSR